MKFYDSILLVNFVSEILTYECLKCLFRKNFHNLIHTLVAAIVGYLKESLQSHYKNYENKILQIGQDLQIKIQMCSAEF